VSLLSTAKADGTARLVRAHVQSRQNSSATGLGLFSITIRPGGAGVELGLIGLVREEVDEKRNTVSETTVSPGEPFWDWMYGVYLHAAPERYERVQQWRYIGAHKFNFLKMASDLARCTSLSPASCETFSTSLTSFRRKPAGRATSRTPRTSATIPTRPSTWGEGCERDVAQDARRVASPHRSGPRACSEIARAGRERKEPSESLARPRRPVGVSDVSELRAVACAARLEPALRPCRLVPSGEPDSAFDQTWARANPLSWNEAPSCTKPQFVCTRSTPDMHATTATK